MTQRVTVLTNIYNEAYILPFWLKYHKNVFDHGIVIDWCSTDNSRDIIRAICPTWEIRQTNNMKDGKPFFETFSADQEIMEIEKTIPGYKIFLNVTEWLMTTGPIKSLIDFNAINKCYPLHVFSPINSLQGYTPQNTKEFIACFRNKLVSVITKRYFRYLFNRSNGEYKGGRHLTNVASDLESIDWNNYQPAMNGMYIVWTAFFPLTDQMWQRKLAVKAHMCKEIELPRGTCFQHFWALDEMKKDYAELCKHNIIKHPDLNLSIDYGIQIAEF